jgi:hypothetical protein
LKERRINDLFVVIRPFLILKDVTKAKMVSVNKDHLQIEAYGRLEKFAPMLETKRFN